MKNEEKGEFSDGSKTCWRQYELCIIDDKLNMSSQRKKFMETENYKCHGKVRLKAQLNQKSIQVLAQFSLANASDFHLFQWPDFPSRKIERTFKKGRIFVSRFLFHLKSKFFLREFSLDADGWKQVSNECHGAWNVLHILNSDRTVYPPAHFSSADFHFAEHTFYENFLFTPSPIFS